MSKSNNFGSYNSDSYVSHEAKLLPKVNALITERLEGANFDVTDLNLELDQVEAEVLTQAARLDTVESEISTLEEKTANISVPAAGSNETPITGLVTVTGNINCSSSVNSTFVNASRVSVTGPVISDAVETKDLTAYGGGTLTINGSDCDVLGTLHTAQINSSDSITADGDITSTTGDVYADRGVFSGQVLSTGGFKGFGSRSMLLDLNNVKDQQMLTYDGVTGRYVDDPVTSFASTQYSTENLTAVEFEDGYLVNGCTFFTSADKSSTGTLANGEISLQYGIEIRVTRLDQAVGDLNIDLVLVPGDPNITLGVPDQGTAAATMEFWVTTHKAFLNANNVRPLWNPNGGDGSLFLGSIRFCASQFICDNLDGGVSSGWLIVKVNPFSKISNATSESTVALQDHFLIPYVGQPYEGQYLQHRFRVNFNLDYDDKDASNCALGLYRYADDTLVASEITLERRQEEKGSTIILGQQHVFVTYTAGPNDPFVEGGFYFGIRNPAGNPSGIIEVGNVGILLQTMYQQPIRF